MIPLNYQRAFAGWRDRLIARVVVIGPVEEAALAKALEARRKARE